MKIIKVSVVALCLLSVLVVGFLLGRTKSKATDVVVSQVQSSAPTVTTNEIESRLARHGFTLTGAHDISLKLANQ